MTGLFFIAACAWLALAVFAGILALGVGADGRRRLRGLLLVLGGLAVGGVAIHALWYNGKLQAPGVEEPRASGVYFREDSGWQYFEVLYRADLPPETALGHAEALIAHYGHGEAVATTSFKGWPLSADYPWWFDPGSVVSGTQLDAGFITALVSDEGRVYLHAAH
jgi:hypothetical protein